MQRRKQSRVYPKITQQSVNQSALRFRIAKTFQVRHIKNFSKTARIAADFPRPFNTKAKDRVVEAIWSMRSKFKTIYLIKILIPRITSQVLKRYTKSLFWNSRPKKTHLTKVKLLRKPRSQNLNQACKHICKLASTLNLHNWGIIS